MPPSQAASTTGQPSKAGIVETADGKRIIPSSVRADGSVRREIRVKAGYRPPEDIEVYRSRRAEEWKNRGSAGGVPGAAPVETTPAATSAASNKNAKRRAAQKKAKEEGEGTPAQDTALKTDVKQDAAPAPAEKTEKSPEEEKEKKAKAIRKKIRQAEELKKKRENGETLLPEQLEKVTKISELTRMLNALGFSE